MTKHTSTPADLAGLLRVYADATEPLDCYMVFTMLNPRDGVPPDARRREWKRWCNRQIELFMVNSDAHIAGYLDETIEATGYEGGRSVITDAGRAWLAERET